MFSMYCDFNKKIIFSNHHNTTTINHAMNPYRNSCTNIVVIIAMLSDLDGGNV